MARTDNSIFPIDQIADLVLTAASQSSIDFYSFANAIRLIHCMVAGISLKVSILQED